MCTHIVTKWINKCKIAHKTKPIKKEIHVLIKYFDAKNIFTFQEIPMFGVLTNFSCICIKLDHITNYNEEEKILTKKCDPNLTFNLKEA